MLAIDDGVIGWTLSDKFRLVSVLFGVFVPLR